MPRPSIVVSRVSAHSAGPLTRLWIESAVAGGMSQEVASRAANDQRVVAALERPETKAFLASYEGAPVGYAVVNTRSLGLLAAASVAIDELYVVPASRHHGVARALLTAVATLAESEACELVVSNVPAGDRVANRYFARLGFGAHIVRRVVPTAVLRRKLCASDESTSAIDTLIGRRRIIRARTLAAAAQAPRLAAPMRQSPAAG